MSFLPRVPRVRATIHGRQWAHRTARYVSSPRKWQIPRDQFPFLPAIQGNLAAFGHRNLDALGKLVVEIDRDREKDRNRAGERCFEFPVLQARIAVARSRLFRWLYLLVLRAKCNRPESTFAGKWSDPYQVQQLPKPVKEVEMKSKNLILSSGIVGSLLLVVACAFATELPQVDGVLGFEQPIETGWMAVSIPIPEGCALVGISWYNNDGTAVFPSVLVGTGYAEGPGLVGEMTPVADHVGGVSNGWSSLTFCEPVAASQGSLYVVFSLPAGSAYEGRGEGGGPGWGYCRSEAGLVGWFGTDGENWIRLSRTAGFAVVPEFVPVTPGMLLKSMDGDLARMIDKPYLEAGPNPFNPRTEIKFGLPEAAQVRLDIYDLRGRRVVRLVDQSYAAGAHSVAWLGQDGQGRGVASGVYFARLKLGTQELTKKLMLVR